MDTKTAADVWKSHMAIYGDQASLVAPSVSQGGHEWLKEFFTKVANPESIEYIGLHWFEGAHQIEYFKTFLEDAYTTFGQRKIFLTEFATTSGDAAQSAQFMTDA